jgi:ribosomal protein L21E
MIFQEGDRVEVYIPIPDDPDRRYHGRSDKVVDVLEDDLSNVMDNPDKEFLYTVEFDDLDLASTTSDTTISRH